MKLKLLENAVMVHIKFTRDRVCDDMEEIDIAIEDYDGWDEEGIENWKKEVREILTEAEAKAAAMKAEAEKVKAEKEAEKKAAKEKAKAEKAKAKAEKKNTEKEDNK